MRDDPGTLERAVRLGRAIKAIRLVDRPEQGARARHLLAGHRRVPQQLGVGLHRHATTASATSRSTSCCAARAEERARVSFLKDLAIPTRGGKAVPITQIADVRYELEEGIVWRRNRLPTITVRADVHGDAQGPDVANRIEPQLDGAPRRRCRSATASRSAARSRTRRAARSRSPPASRCCVVVVLTLLMIQLQSFSRTLMVVLTAPLGLIGVVAGAARCSASRSASSRCSARSRCPASSCATR